MTHDIPDEERGKVWLAFDNKTPLEDAYHRFHDKYGEYPREHYYVPPGMLFVGPVIHVEKQ